MQTKLAKQSIIAAIFLLLFMSLRAQAQNTIKGRVLDEKKRPVLYASVSLKSSTDGSLTDSLGRFSFTTNASGNLVLIVSAVGFQELQHPLEITSQTPDLQLILKTNAKQLGEVVVTAGTIDATDDRILTIIKPVDILSNASSQGDIVGAIQNLPGVQRNGGDETGLFVRGGDASETVMIIDGTTVQNAFFSAVPGIGQRSRFNPFQIKGTSFSSGGYSAKYGQALSSVLSLQTTDLPQHSTISAGLNLSGAMVIGAEKMENNAIEYAANYTNFGAYYGLAKTNYEFFRKPVSGGGSLRWISKDSKGGIFKTSISFNSSGSGTFISNPNAPGSIISFDLKNENTNVNSSYRTRLSDKWKLLLAAGISSNHDNILWSDTAFTRSDRRSQLRTEFTFSSKLLKFTAGAELQHFSFEQQFDSIKGKFDETMAAAFGEAEFRITRNIALKPGLRAEYSDLLRKGNIAPRFALALKAGPFSQFGLATGLFYQSAPNLYLLNGLRPGYQHAIHYLANYEWIQNNRSFRLEAYYKDYANLVREQGVPYLPRPFRTELGSVDNSGSGYAKGFDIFWRDKASIKNIDYWITYSFIDTRRLYQNYSAKASPDFISENNLNVIVKYYSEKLHTALSAGYNYSSGRPYYNPMASGFLADKAPAYHNLSFKASYLTNIRRVFAAFYVNFDNLTNQKNVLGYRYSNDGQLRTPVLPPQYFAVFFGVHLSISQFKKDDL
ncbi:TonB-dependent receptor [Pseudoflavitalea sp. G-6-1-2]|uniref:TonB-dependent receptor n=1 Tax=Pseudoflavitalea sp. G-6-1-2 TaxID=2728841 RepID=UPI00146EC6E2|nr:TonB-dependent receptor [Pseudoflavitalea sp. G-6-1-2]NML22086.1 TonB-dependent receptor [Pseudoflavitalea sp. G-6-1-2]